jgi:hypothetical protein
MVSVYHAAQPKFVNLTAPRRLLPLRRIESVHVITSFVRFDRPRQIRWSLIRLALCCVMAANKGLTPATGWPIGRGTLPGPPISRVATL